MYLYTVDYTMLSGQSFLQSTPVARPKMGHFGLTDLGEARTVAAFPDSFGVTIFSIQYGIPARTRTRNGRTVLS